MASTAATSPKAASVQVGTVSTHGRPAVSRYAGIWAISHTQLSANADRTRVAKNAPSRCDGSVADKRLSSGLQLGAPQPQRVADDRNRTEAHRRGRDHRAQEQAEEWVEHPGRDRDA